MATTFVVPLSLESLLSYFPDIKPNDRILIERAYHRAEVAHAGVFRKSGEPYFTHCVSVAMILAEMRLDAEAIAAALLHDVIEDTEYTYEDIRDEFGVTIARMVDGVTKIKNLPTTTDRNNTGKRTSAINREMEYMRKMLLTIGDDIRVVLIKLADRLHNMRTLGYMRPEKQREIARETLDIFAPLANRLGIWQIKWELEDLCLRYLDPDVYKNIARLIDERRADREQYMQQVAQTLRAELEKNSISKVHITGRPKHIYSIYRKMQRKQVSFDQIYDVRAIRVIVENKAECYHALGVVHSMWRPVHGEFDDYIAGPKDNFYQSLHTAVRDERGKVLEVQIRTWEMHEHAEYGIAAHWRYKEGSGKHDEQFQKRIAYLRHIMEFGYDMDGDAEDFVDTMKTEVFQDRLYVFTPKGDIIDLPVGSTPIDFAYHVHTDVGHQCRGAKVNGQLVNLNYNLKTGDQIEIIASKRGGPSMDWLNEDLGYVRTQRARQKIKQWFRKLNRDKHISLGREVLEREMRRLGVLDSIPFETVANMLDYTDINDFLAAVGAGDITGAQISNRVLDEENKRREREEFSTLLTARARANAQVAVDRTKGVEVMGTPGLLTTLATCCSPMVGDNIVGYVTRGHGVTIHRKDCRNVEALKAKDAERLKDVSWGELQEERRYTVPIEIIAYDRDGLLLDITKIVADEKVNIIDVRVTTRQDIAVINLVLEITSHKQLTRILSRIGMIKSVTETFRRSNH